MYIRDCGCHLFIVMFNKHCCNTNEDRWHVKKTMNIILLHRSFRQDYLNTITHLREKEFNMKWLHISIQNKLQLIILNRFTIRLTYTMKKTMIKSFHQNSFKQFTNSGKTRSSSVNSFAISSVCVNEMVQTRLQRVVLFPECNIIYDFYFANMEPNQNTNVCAFSFVHIKCQYTIAY